MHEREYEAMYGLEGFYWWFVARRALVVELLKKEIRDRASVRILDVGCGTGANAKAFETLAPTVGIDASIDAVRFCRRRGLRSVARSPVEVLPFAHGTFDIVTALDLLEHTDDDLQCLREIHRVSQKNALVVVTVPAYGFLWSEHDEALQHRRRYTAHELRNKLTATGFQVLRTSYFISTLFVPILAFRVWQGRRKAPSEPKTGIVVLPAWINEALVRLLALERRVFRLMNLPFGVSIVALARPANVQNPPANAGA